MEKTPVCISFSIAQVRIYRYSYLRIFAILSQLLSLYIWHISGCFASGTAATSATKSNLCDFYRLKKPSDSHSHSHGIIISPSYTHTQARTHIRIY